MIPAHRSASAYPNRKGCPPLRLFFIRRRTCVLVLASILLVWVLVQLVSRDKPPAWQPIYHPFSLPSSHAAAADTRIRSIASQAALSDDCVEQWIASGIWDSGSCRNVEESRIDMIYTWVNVSGIFSVYHVAHSIVQGIVSNRHAESLAEPTCQRSPSL